MMDDYSPPSIPMSPEDLHSQVLDLRHQLAELNLKNHTLWTLLAKLGRKLQVSSASIKAAVSSLLDYDILWDASTQHEFLETIDSSVDQASNLIALLTLISSYEAGGLEMRREPHQIQEIFSTVLYSISAEVPELNLNIVFPSEGHLVLVDYNHLSLCLRLLFEVIATSNITSQQVEVLLTEAHNHWYLDISGIERSIVDIITMLSQWRIDDLTLIEQFSPENLLKLLIASQILHWHDLEIDAHTNGESETSLRLSGLSGIKS